MALNIVDNIDNWVKVNNVLISVSDKKNLDQLVPSLLKLNPELKIYSTGGTYQKIKEILNNDTSDHLVQVSSYTGQPETQGGLVKTLDFKIYLGLLTETYNEAHQNDMERTGAITFDMVVVNLYPFQKTIAQPETTLEMARGNIDIGGPCMIRASAKNFIRVLPLINPFDYAQVISELENHDCCTSLKLRYRMALKAFAHTADYDQAIYKYLMDQPYTTVASCYNLKDE